jgi:hypothetical protein
MKEKSELDKLKDDVYYLIVAHCKYKDMLMYDRALKKFQEDINYGQLEEMSYNERFAFLLGFETSLKAVEERYGFIKVDWRIGKPFEQRGLISESDIEKMVSK